MECTLYSPFPVQLIAWKRTGGLHKQVYYSMNTSLSMYMYIHARDPSCRLWAKLKVKLWKLMKEDTKNCQLKVELWKVMEEDTQKVVNYQRVGCYIWSAPECALTDIYRLSLCSPMQMLRQRHKHATKTYTCIGSVFYSGVHVLRFQHKLVPYTQVSVQPIRIIIIVVRDAPTCL